MTKTEFRGHPLMIFDMMKPFLFVFVLPVIKGVIQYLIYKKVSGIISLETAVFVFVLTLSLFRYKNFIIIFSGDELIIKSGFLLKSTFFVSQDKISCISGIRSPADMIFSSVKCTLNTESGRRGNFDFKFRLKKSDYTVFRSFLYEKTEQRVFKASPVKIALWSAATSSAFLGLVVGVPTINRLGKLLGIAANEKVFNKISEVSKRYGRYMPPIINTVTLIFLGAYTIGFIIQFFKNLRFFVEISDETVKIKSGIIERKETVFKKNAVNSVSIEQTFLMRLTKRYYMKANLAGLGDRKSKSTVIAPCGKKTELENLFLPHFRCLKVTENGICCKKDAKTFFRFVYLPGIIALAGIMAAILLIRFFPVVRPIILFCLTVFLAFDLCFADVSLYNYRNGKLVFGKFAAAFGSRGLRRCELYCETGRIGEIILKQTPADRRYETCKVRIRVFSENGESLLVRNINKAEVLREIEKI